ncbi:MAG: hypothetical protein A3D53_00120 [Candidatus Magasanikbacteria bacterium RIFCSPHIGHO2_02_FULL_45_10]|uniref:Uncharacterized protein n=1 Tax=Candidatus Magasanikbacteria bacterium RIFCSPHIGHO2_02_FULL_45_10 TaxID=1798679 RepID=A0A1F6MB02_9BACT|nr:MAG: hypothetical protein A3D53_00120 [Candidatus Magasanikbacteria bacterium RIFCSPHIGHO2_02_FULL_45_10]
MAKQKENSEIEQPVVVPKIQNHQPLIYAVLGTIIIALSFAVAYLWQKTNTPVESPKVISKEEQQLDYIQYIPPKYIPPEEPKKIVDVGTPLLEVAWEKKVTRLEQECERDCSIENYFAGVITNGKYSGEKLYMEIICELGGCGPTYYIQKDGKIFFDSTIAIKGITDLPDRVVLLGTNYKLVRGYSQNLFSKMGVIKKWFTDPKLGDFYLLESGLFIVELPDHTSMVYELDIPFINRENGAVNIAFSDGVSNTETYNHGRPSCGAIGFNLAIVDEKILKPSERLVIAGKTGSSENIYQIKNRSDAALKELYNDKNTVAYYFDEGASTSTSKYTYEQFLSYHPLLYWKNPMGGWVEFKNHRFEIAAEMCKPVIYLYPEETIRLTVQVHPNGGFTFTSPAYDNGWFVEARPDGHLKDLKTGKEYGYLFWEGIGLQYPIEKDAGWVVQRENVSAFFDEMLPKLGLAGREIIDFKEYWVNRLNERPFYQLSFLKKAEFDRLAPLEVTPQEPNSIIRIMLTAQGLDAFREVAPQELEAPSERRGFTLVEWGGVVLK